ncbi:hybrid sensor histidine kinase/response regulator [Baaleninema simplex]|uniref:hybrid sensor histidine kinase/response regulator n=1 Tax=Baaleninema simplex TaxID=2862350 RepID=UPI00034AE316|nr:response regulator [Baaleninema simplex]
MGKILIIEDEQDIREIVVEILSEADYETLEAENGAVGIELASQHSLDLIICDVMMPELDGYGVLRALRQNPVTQTVPFIFLTAKAEKTQIRQGMELGADDYLPKPFTIAELLATVATRLEKKAALERVSQYKLDELRHNLTRSLPHELLTPLNGILGYATFLEEDGHSMDRAEIQEMAASISTSARRLHHLIQNFLLYAQLELVKGDSRRMQLLLRGQTESARKAIETVAREIAQQYDRLDDLYLQLDDASLAVAENWIAKAIAELTDNAFKFSQAGTPVEVRSQLDGDRFVFSTVDRGRGFQPEQIERVGAYEQFERKIYEQQGSGLGLAITKRLAELNGGTLTIDSTPSQTTIVSVTLPVRVEDEEMRR